MKHAGMLSRVLTVALFITLLDSSASAASLDFTPAQVETGQAFYKATCQLCHGTTLANGQFGTPLKGAPFQDKWQGKTLGDLLGFVYEKMPPDKVKSLTPEQTAAVTAFILARNGIAVSATPLEATAATTRLPW